MLKLAGKQIKLAMENPALTVDSLTTPGLLIAMCVLFSENLPMASMVLRRQDMAWATTFSLTSWTIPLAFLCRVSFLRGSRRLATEIH